MAFVRLSCEMTVVLSEGLMAKVWKTRTQKATCMSLSSAGPLAGWEDRLMERIKKINHPYML